MSAQQNSMHSSHYSQKSNASNFSKFGGKDVTPKKSGMANIGRDIMSSGAKPMGNQVSGNLLNEYEAELERLREENNQIRFTKDLRERDFENVMFENA